MKIEKYPAYKDSGIEWLGEIPSHWEVKRVKYLFNIGRGRVISQQELVENGLYPVYSSQTQNNGVLGLINTYDFDCKQITWTTDGANAGTVFLREGKHNCTNVCGTLKPLSNEQVIEFITFALQVAAQFYKRPDTNGAKIMNGEMAEIFVTIPPLLEQIKIANFLDQKTQKIDKAINIKEKQISLLKERRQIVIHNAVTKGLNYDLNDEDENYDYKNQSPSQNHKKSKFKDSGVEWIGQIPEHWEIKKVKFLFKLVGGGTPSKERKDYWNGDIPWVSPKDMKSDYINSTEDNMTLKGLLNSSANYIKSNTLLMVVRSGILQRTIPVAISKVGLTLNQDMKAFIQISDILTEFFFYYIKGNDNFLKNEWVKQGATVESVEVELLKNGFVTIPPSNEQVNIINYIESISEKISKAIYLKEKEIEKLKEYKATLINSAVTGKIKVS